MQQVADWLEKLGMSEYAQRFAENGIDFAVLSDLTDQDLKDIGVLLGHRRKMLRAIAELKNAPALAATPASARPVATSGDAASAASSGPTGTEADGERRFLKVMFCDLVGSTGIAAKLDAEEWRDLVGAYLDAASTAVTDMNGHVAKKLGDGILALFGYPVAHENDAERAARAALSIQRALADLNRKNAGSGKPELHARIGLETGPAVVDAAGEIYGDVANVAARVQALAEPGAVLITSRVQRQIAALFVAEERGTHARTGVPEPVALFKLVRASGGGRRARQRQLTPLVGRDDEITMLMRRWERARAGDGQLMLIVGEPGIGKSRLIEEFRARLSDIPHTWVAWSCSQLLQNTPLHPIAEWGRQRFGGADVPAERRLAELESSLAQVKLDPAESASLLAPLFDIPLPKERTLTSAGEELRRRQLAALTNWVMAGAKVQPVVLAFEDLHWADPTTLDVLKGIAEQGALAPLFILATTRPEFRPPWSLRSHHGTVSLSPLDRAQVRDMVAELSARHALPKDVVEDVAARTGGVPLFAPKRHGVRTKGKLTSIHNLSNAWALDRPNEQMEVAVRIADECIPIRRPDDPRSGNIIRFKPTGRTADRVAIRKQLKVWTAPDRYHRQNIDFDVGQPIESHLRRSVVDRRAALRQTESFVEAAARTNLGNADRRVVDAEQPFALPLA
jgi:class 3 adenylate cyclase